MREQDATMSESPAEHPMQLYRAVCRHHREGSFDERNLDLYARNMEHAVLSAKELVGKAELVRVFHNPDWS